MIPKGPKTQGKKEEIFTVKFGKEGNKVRFWSGGGITQTFQESVDGLFFRNEGKGDKEAFVKALNELCAGKNFTIFVPDVPVNEAYYAIIESENGGTIGYHN